MREENLGAGLSPPYLPELPVGRGSLGDDGGGGRQRWVQGVVAQVQRQRARAHDGWGGRRDDDGLGGDLLKRGARDKRSRAVSCQADHHPSGHPLMALGTFSGN